MKYITNVFFNNVVSMNIQENLESLIIMTAFLQVTIITELCRKFNILFVLRFFYRFFSVQMAAINIIHVRIRD